MGRATARGTIAGLLAVMLAGCLRKPPPRASPPPEPPRGEVTFQALVDIPAPRPRDASTEEVLPPVAMRHDPPLYPTRPLAAGHGPATVVVRVIIAATGRVEQVTDSPLMESTAGPFAEDFRSAVAEALKAWVFQPALWRQMENGQDLDGDGVTDYRK